MFTINLLTKTVDWITDITKWIANLTMALMMAFIFVAVISRAFNFPIIGDVEIVQFGMVVLIMFSMAYSQREDAHLSIGFIVDRFSPRVQAVFDVIAHLLTFLICIVIGWVFIGDTWDNFVTRENSELLNIPFYLFKVVISIGFIMWGLQAFLKVIQSIIQLKKGEFIITKKGEGDIWL
ncbi:TRAP transporter small permease [Neobacillus driksii]|uniref:TRAP transporter small permease n=1 Tax=Neobacillus driksii TaxID=3035913 RepID=UPI0035BC8C1F